MVLGKVKENLYPLNFHGGGKLLKTTYKRTNEDIEAHTKRLNSMDFNDVLNIHMERIKNEENA